MGKEKNSINVSQNSFFATQSPMNNNSNAFHLFQQLDGLNRLKNLKNQMRQLALQKNRAQSQYLRAKKSVDSLSRKTQKTKTYFTKLYESKKLKLSTQQIIQQKQMQTKEVLKTARQKTRQQRLLDQLQLQATRNQQISKNERKKQMNKKQKQKIKKQMKLNNLEHFVNSRNSYRKIKQHKSQIMNRNRKIQEILFMKGKYNYAQKTQKQMEQIRAYELLLSQLQEVQKKENQYRPMTAFSKSFFVTNMPNQILKTQEKPVSTRATYRAKSRHL